MSILYTKRCIVCGKEFMCRSKKALCCEGECRRIRGNEIAREYRKTIKMTEKKKIKPKYSIAQISVKAKEAGMSYGEYVQKML